MGSPFLQQALICAELSLQKASPYLTSCFLKVVCRWMSCEASPSLIKARSTHPKKVYGCFQKIGVPQNGWFISWKTLLKWMIWGENPLFSEHPYILLGYNYNLTWSDSWQCATLTFTKLHYTTPLTSRNVPVTSRLNGEPCVLWGKKEVEKKRAFSTCACI